MIKSFDLKDEKKLNEFYDEHSDDIGQGVMVNVEPGRVVFQIDKGVERRGILNGLRTAHGELLAKKLSREADKRYFMSELIKANGKLAQKQGGTGRQDELHNFISGLEKQIHDVEGELNLFEHQLRTNKEIYESIRGGKMDGSFL